MGWHATKIGDRWAAPAPLRQYTADAWIGKVRWLGMTISPSYVGEPECNGVIERFMRTLKEQRLYLYQFASLEEARRVIGAFIHRYNEMPHTSADPWRSLGVSHLKAQRFT